MTAGVSFRAGDGELPRLRQSSAGGWQFVSDDCFLLVGQGVSVDFSHATDTVELDHAEEGRFENGRWVAGRVLNGDERLQLVPVDDVGAVRIRLLRTPAPDPARWKGRRE